MKKLLVSLCCVLGLAACAQTRPPAAIVSVPAAASVDIGFSPDGSAEALVIRAIASARQSIRLAAYSFTASFVVDALIAAKQRGVDVAVVVDHKDNVVQDRSGHARPALDALAGAGIRVRSVSAFRKQHNKYMVIDGRHVETGSFNFAESARENAENVLVLWNAPELARVYAANWQVIFDRGADYGGISNWK